MATPCFLKNVADFVTADYASLGTPQAKIAGGAIGWTTLPIGLTRGSGQSTSDNTATVTGTTTGIEAVSGSLGLQWISPPLDRDVTIAGTITLNLWAAENNMSANVAINAYIDRLDSLGAVISRVATTARTTEMAVSPVAVNNFTVTPTSTNFLKGDRIRIVLFGDDAGTMASGFTFIVSFAGTTGGAAGDTFVTFTETFGFLTTNPSPAIVEVTDPSDNAAYTLAGGTTADSKLAEDFIPASTFKATSVMVRGLRIGSPSDDLVMSLGTSIGASDLASVSIPMSGISTSVSWVVFALPSPVTLTASTSYYITLTRTGPTNPGGDTTNAFNWRYDTANSYASGQMWSYGGASWTNPSGGDFRFLVDGFSGTGTVLYPTDTASDIDPGGANTNTKVAWTSRAAASVNANRTGTKAGPTAPLQYTKSYEVIDFIAGSTFLNSIFGVTSPVGNPRRLAQSFVAADTETVFSLGVRVAKVGSPVDNLVMEIQTDSGGAPSGTVVMTDNFPGASLSTSPNLLTFGANTVLLTGGATYWVVLTRSGAASSSNFYQWEIATASYAGGVPLRDDGGTWVTTGTGDHTLTLSARGNYIEWYTKPLTAFTLAAPVLFNGTASIDIAARNAALRAELAITASDGTGPTVWAATSHPTALGTSSNVSYSFYLAGDDVAVTDGSRIRIRIYFDDPSASTMVVGGLAAMAYGAQSVGVDGDTYLIFDQVLTEFVAAGGGAPPPRSRTRKLHLLGR